MKLEAGMYVRTKEGYICKILKLNEEYENDGYLDHNNIGSASIQEKNIIKASYNIIDLIEKNDFINEMRVSEIKEKTNEYIKFMADSDYEFVTTLYEKDIYNILTHEQFENNCFKIGDK